MDLAIAKLNFAHRCDESFFQNRISRLMYAILFQKFFHTELNMSVVDNINIDVRADSVASL